VRVYDFPYAHTFVNINLCEDRDGAYLLFLFNEIMPVLVELDQPIPLRSMCTSPRRRSSYKDISCVTVTLQVGCYLGSPTWTCGVTQGNSEGSRVQGECVEHRGLLRDWDDTRSSPHPSVVALGCLDGGDERGGGQGCYSR
jgi:hypothetical protein